LSHTPILLLLSPYFFSNDTATTKLYTLSLHDALPIFFLQVVDPTRERGLCQMKLFGRASYRPCPRNGKKISELFEVQSVSRRRADRKSTRLNSSHVKISYAVFCLKKKKKRYNLSDYSI